MSRIASQKYTVKMRGRDPHVWASLMVQQGTSDKIATLIPQGKLPLREINTLICSRDYVRMPDKGLNGRALIMNISLTSVGDDEHD